MYARRARPVGPPLQAASVAVCVLVVATAALVQRYGVALPGLPDQSATSELLGAVSTLLGAAACAAAGFGARAEPGSRRTPWAVLGAGLATWGVADLIWFGYAAVGAEAPYPGPADVFYLIGIPVLGLGLVGLARGAAEVWQRDARVTVDTLVLAAAMGLVTHLLVLRTVVDALGVGVQAGLSLLYPLSEAAFAALTGVLVVRSRGVRHRPDLVLLTAGFLSYWLADGYFVVAEVTGRDYAQSPLQLGYVAGPLLIGLGAVVTITGADRGVDSGRAGRPSGRLARSLPAVLPDMGAIAAVLTCVAVPVRGAVDWALTASVLALMTYRQVLIATDNQRLLAELSEKVRERTANLQWLSDHHEGILASVGEGVVGVDASGRVTFANPAATELLRGGVDGLLGADIRSIVSDASHDPGAENLVDVVRRTGTSLRRVDHELVRYDGTRVPVDVTVTPRRGPGATSGVVLVFRDISERRAMAQMKSQFVSAVSHELRTPLTSIRGALEMMDDGEAGELPPLASHMVASALRGSERLGRLVSDIIDVERLDAGSFPMRLSDVDVGDVVETAVTGLEVVAAHAHVRIVVTHATGRACCDVDRLVQALVNLVGNAVKFSPPGASVEVSAEPQGDDVLFTVTDRGRGIPEHHLEAIFERFHQVEVSDAREKAGTGLGLPITRSIVEQHGGRIGVRSTPGHGSCFWFTVPRAAAMVAEALG